MKRSHQENSRVNIDSIDVLKLIKHWNEQITNFRCDSVPEFSKRKDLFVVIYLTMWLMIDDYSLFSNYFLNN